jgi:proteic killer suppression protein
LIQSFKHKGLEKFYFYDSKAGIQPAHAEKLREQLTALHFAESAEDMNNPGWRFHRLHGDLSGYWSVRVNGNWRLTFRFMDGCAEAVDYQDYH